MINKILIAVTIVLVIVLVGLGGVFFLRNKNGTPTPNEIPVLSESGTDQQVPSILPTVNPSAESRIIIEEIQINPSLAVLGPKKEAVFMNRMQKDITIVSDDGSFTEQQLKPNQLLNISFTSNGKHGYSIKGTRLRGSVVVQLKQSL
jgi:hypothetical protein